MKKIICFFLLLYCYNAIAQKGAYEYPIIVPSDHKDKIHGVQVQDPFRFLEESRSNLTKTWLAKQINLSNSYINQTNLQNAIYKRIEQRSFYNLNFEKKSGSYFFSYRFKFKNQSPALYFRKYDQKFARLLINPGVFDLDTNTITSIVDYSLSNDEQFIAISISTSGSDWKEIRLINIKTRKLLKDQLKWIKYSNVVWVNNGFYYTRYEQPPLGEEKIALNQNSRIYFHELNTNQSEDKLIYEQSNIPFGLFNLQSTNLGNLIIYGAEYTEGKYIQNVFYKDLRNNNEALKGIINSDLDLNYSYEIIAETDSSFIVLSNSYQNLEKSLFIYNKLDVNSKPRLFIKLDSYIKSAQFLNHKIVVVSAKDMSVYLTCYNLDGIELDRRKFQSGAAISNISSSSLDSILFFYINTYTSPPVACEYNTNTYHLDIKRVSKISYPEIKIIYETVNYNSHDGQLIPMTIIRREDTRYDGNQMAMIYGYGGFGVPIEPFYDPGFIFFVQNGGVIAVPGIRGGGENGEAWHEAGRLFNKMNGIKDFAYAAKYLINKRITNPSKLCARGSSNGALIIASCINLYPDLFKAVVLEMGLYDMLRYHLFTTGYLASTEYGTSLNQEEFKNLITYSPIHNINEGNLYPSMYVVTGTNDDKAPSLHSYKYVASLQKLKQKHNIVLLNQLENAGHYGPQSFESILINESAIYSFLFNELSMKIKVKN